MIRKRIPKLFAAAAATALLAGLGVAVAPTASAEQRIPLANGLTAILQDPGADGSRSVRTFGVPRVDGDYATNQINVRINGGNQFERDLDFESQLSDTFILSRDQVNISVQACRDWAFPDPDPDSCGEFSDFKNDAGQQAQFLPKTPCNPPGDFLQAEVPAGQQCVPKPKPPVKCEPAANFEAAEVPFGQQCVAKPPKKCPVGSVKAEVPFAENCAPPTDTVRMTIGGGALQRTVTVNNSGPLGGTCAYNAEPTGGLFAPALNRQIDVGPNASNSIDVPAPPLGSTYNVTLKCTGDYDGRQVQFGQAQQDVSSF